MTKTRTCSKEYKTRSIVDETSKYTCKKTLITDEYDIRNVQNAKPNKGNINYNIVINNSSCLSFGIHIWLSDMRHQEDAHKNTRQK